MLGHVAVVDVILAVADAPTIVGRHGAGPMRFGMIPGRAFLRVAESDRIRRADQGHAADGDERQEETDRNESPHQSHAPQPTQRPPPGEGPMTVPQPRSPSQSEWATKSVK